MADSFIINSSEAPSDNNNNLFDVELFHVDTKPSWHGDISSFYPQANF